MTLLFKLVIKNDGACVYVCVCVCVCNTATHYYTLHHTATHCTILQYTATQRENHCVCVRVFSHCNALQHAASFPNVLQCAGKKGKL